MSFDVERDFPFLQQDRFMGLREAMPVLLETVSQMGFRSDVFVESAVLRQLPHSIRALKESGTFVGLHGDHVEPRVWTQCPTPEVERWMTASVETFHSALGALPVAFRAANFAVDARILSLVAAHGILLDASVLPNRRKKRWGFRTVVDHRGARTTPYHPDAKDHQAEGKMRILEVPTTENPLNPGSPIGMGYLNLRGAEETMRALKNSSGDPTTFLIHPWEDLDVNDSEWRVPRWVRDICRENVRGLRELLSLAAAEFAPASLADIAREYEVLLK